MKATTSVAALAILACAVLKTSEAINCYHCPAEKDNNAVLDCRDPDNNYHGELKTCTGGNLSPDLCLKQSGKPEDFNNNALNNVGSDKVVIRGCVDTTDPAPWDNDWEVKNRCKTKDGVKTCTCKDDEMCNSAFTTSAAIAAIVLSTIASYIFA